MNNKENFSRRNFIEKCIIGAAGTGLVLSSNPLLANSLIPDEIFDGKKHKIAIIGCGARSESMFNALNMVPELEISAICDIVPNKLEKRASLIKNDPKPQFYTNVKELLKHPGLDAVAIITPPNLHKEQAIAAMEAGLHVFCEKPMALTVADCNEMIAAAKRTNKSLQIGTQRRHSNDHKLLVETIRNADIGKVLQSNLYDYRGDWRYPAADEYPPGVGYWRLDQKISGGVVYEMGAHVIDVNNWIFDSEPVSVTSIQGVNNLNLRKRDSMDHGGVIVQYANGGQMIYGGNVYNYAPRVPNTFFGEKGTVLFGDGEVSVHYGSLPGIPKRESITKKLPKGEAEMQQMRYFAKVVAGKEKAYPDGHIGRQTVQILEGAARSSKEKKEIDVRKLG
jgi:predicted dehydrogenase